MRAVSVQAHCLSFKLVKVKVVLGKGGANLVFLSLKDCISSWDDINTVEDVQHFEGIPHVRFEDSISTVEGYRSVLWIYTISTVEDIQYCRGYSVR